MTEQSNIGRILVSEKELAVAAKQAAVQIEKWYQGNPMLLVSILNGAFIFMADVCRQVRIPYEIGFMRVRSYFDSTAPTGALEILMDLSQDIAGYDVVILEDIVDTGQTLRLVTELLASRHALSVRVITLLDKPSRRTVAYQPELALFTIPNVFVIGYGMDCAEHYRGLPYIAEYIGT